MNKIQKIQIGAAALLLLCLIPFPYGVYTLARFIMMILGGYLAYHYYSIDKKALAILFGAIALLFQPFVKLALGRELWMVVDVVVAILLLVLAFKDKLSTKR